MNELKLNYAKPRLTLFKSHFDLLKMKIFGLRAVLLVLVLSCPLIGEELEAGIGKLSLSLSEGISRSGIKKVSVIDFTDLDGRPSELGRFMAEDLSVALVNSAKGFSVMDRANMRKVLDELKLAASGLVDPAKAKEAGHMAGVDAIILGTITQFGDSLIITAKAVSIESTEVLAASKVSITRTKEIESLLKPETGIAQRTIAESHENSQPKPPERDFSAPNAEVVSGNMAFEIRSFKKSNQGVTVFIKVTNRSKTAPIRIGLNEISNWDGTIIGASLFDEEAGSPLSLAQVRGLTYSKSRYGNDPSNYASLRRMAAEVEKSGDRSGAGTQSALQRDLDMMTEIEIGQSADFSFTFASKTRAPGNVFRLSAEVIVAEIVQEGRIARVTMKNVSIPSIRAN
jgi:TolB-like protein